MMRIFILLIIMFKAVQCEFELHDNKVDLRLCKVSHLGLSYTGTIGVTREGERCQRWSDELHVRRRHVRLVDADFPAKSMRRAKNYCRNPTSYVDGPWCFIRAVEQAGCGIPLCGYKDCRMTGPGMEYAGTSRLAHKCRPWTVYESQKKRSNETRYLKDIRFPENNVHNAFNYCRNPNGDLAGPWCYTDTKQKTDYDRIYCDVEFCEHRDCEVVSKQESPYSHFLSYRSSESNIAFSVRLWDPDRVSKAAVKLMLSAICVPATDTELKKWSLSIELTISNDGTGLTIGSKNVRLERTPEILKATGYTDFTLSWANSTVILYKVGETEPLFVTSLRNLNAPLNDLDVNYYSVAGDVAMWDLPYCYDEMPCQEHTTFLPNRNMMWHLHQDVIHYKLNISVRGYGSGFIYFTMDPYNDYPRVTLVIDQLQERTRILYELKGDSKVVATVNCSDILGYWSFTRLHITIAADEILVHRYRSRGRLYVSDLLIRAEHDVVKYLRWFSIGSSNSVCHWTIYCEKHDLPVAYPPDCAMTEREVNYRGKEWVSKSGLPCLPWIASSISKELGYTQKHLRENVNYCRNVFKRSSGPWCFVHINGSTVEESCSIRKCRSLSCKTAGTANDYSGALNVTRSNRVCKMWTSVPPGTYSNVNATAAYFNSALNRARNYCRNPTNTVGGAWCYTMDGALEKDLCNVPDCDKDESHIVLVQHGNSTRLTYILPAWKNTGLHFALKQWNPECMDGIIFKIFPSSMNRFLSLSIGENKNQKLILRYNNELLVHKTYPHLVPAGQWRDFWLIFKKGGLHFGYEGAEYPLFEWKTDDENMNFEPTFFSYDSIEYNVIGVYFPDVECHLENVTSESHTKLYPVNLWEEEYWKKKNNITFNLLGAGTVVIPLFTFPATNDYYLALVITKRTLEITINTLQGVKLMLTKKFNRDLFDKTHWTRFCILYEETAITIMRELETLIKWKPESPTPIYYFTISCREGWFLWSVCNVTQMNDTRSVDGGWSDWLDVECSVTCGGGIGSRRRYCDNPEPNIFGKYCEGPAMEFSSCNDFNCGEVSPKTYEIIRHNLRKQYFSALVEEGGSVRLKSPYELIARIKRESPDSQVYWTHEDLPLDFKKANKYKISKSWVVTIRNVDMSDSGVYLCILSSNTSVKTPIMIVVLAVQSKNAHKSVRFGSTFSLICNSSLPSIFSHLIMEWHRNGALLSIRSMAPGDSFSIFTVPYASERDKGTWTCYVDQVDLGLRWMTNIYTVDVIPYDRSSRHIVSIINDVIDSDVLVIVLLSAIVLVSVILIAFGPTCYMCCRTLTKSRRAIKAEYPDKGGTVAYRDMIPICCGRGECRRHQRASRIGVCYRDSELFNVIEEDELQSDEIVN